MSGHLSAPLPPRRPVPSLLEAPAPAPAHSKANPPPVQQGAAGSGAGLARSWPEAPHSAPPIQCARRVGAALGSGALEHPPLKHSAGAKRSLLEPQSGFGSCARGLGAPALPELRPECGARPFGGD